MGNGIYSRHGLTGVLKQKLGSDQYGAEPHLRFCSTHLTVGDTGATAQMQSVLARLEAWWAQQGDTVFLAGDSNLAANHPGLDPVYSDSVDTPPSQGAPR